MRLLRAAVVVALGLLTADGCTRTVYHAVIIPHAPRDEGRCFGDCQVVRPKGTKEYLACVRNCPGTRVIDEQQCGAVDYDGNRFGCATEQNQIFSPVEVLVGIVLGVIVFGFLVFYYTRGYPNG